MSKKEKFSELESDGDFNIGMSRPVVSFPVVSVVLPKANGIIDFCDKGLFSCDEVLNLHLQDIGVNFNINHVNCGKFIFIIRIKDVLLVCDHCSLWVRLINVLNFTDLIDACENYERNLKLDLLDVPRIQLPSFT